MDKLVSVLGIARRAGKLLIGRDAVMASAKKGAARLVLLTNDASPRHVKELNGINYKGEIRQISLTMDETDFYLGKRSCIFALEDDNFIKAIQKLI